MNNIDLARVLVYNQVMTTKTNYNKEYWVKNKIRIMQKRKDNEYYKDYYARNIEYQRNRLKEYKRSWTLKNPERAKEINRNALIKWKENNQASYRYSAILKNCKKRRREISITKNDFIDWFNKTEKSCSYCGISEEFSKKIKQKVLEIDRIDNSIGYKLDNIVFACYICNGLKSNLLTGEETKFIGINIIKNKWSAF